MLTTSMYADLHHITISSPAPDPAPLSSFKAPTPGPDTVDYCSEGTWESADSSMHEVLRQCGKDVAVAMTSVSWSRSSNRSLSRLLCELDRDPVRNMKAARIVDDDWHLNVLEREKQPDKDDRISAEKGWGVFSQNAVVLSRHIHRGFRHGTLALMPLPNAGWIDRNTIRPLDERWTGQRWYKDMYLPLPDDVFRIELEDNLNWDDLTLDVIPTAKTSPSYDDYGGNDAWHRLGPRGAFLDAAGMLRILARPNIVDEDLLEWLRAFFAGDSSQANGGLLWFIRRGYKDLIADQPLLSLQLTKSSQTLKQSQWSGSKTGDARWATQLSGGDAPWNAFPFGIQGTGQQQAAPGSRLWEHAGAVGHYISFP